MSIQPIFLLPKTRCLSHLMTVRVPRLVRMWWKSQGLDTGRPEVRLHLEQLSRNVQWLRQLANFGRCRFQPSRWWEIGCGQEKQCQGVQPKPCLDRGVRLEAQNYSTQQRRHCKRLGHCFLRRWQVWPLNNFLWVLILSSFFSKWPNAICSQLVQMNIRLLA